MNCRHTVTVPVHAKLRTDVIHADSVCDHPPVAHLCLTCDAQLPANWGCTDCEWEHVESRRFCDPVLEIHAVCTRRCPTHQEARP